MNVIKKLLLILVIIITITGVCGCMDFTSKKNNNRKESDSEYSEMFKSYIEEKYSKSFEIVSTDFPESGFNTGMKQNVVVLRDDDGVTCNVTAYLSTPYSYYDDYVESYTASLIEAEIDNAKYDSVRYRIYVTVKNRNMDETNVSSNNILSLTFVGKVDHSPEEKDLQGLYEIYDELVRKGYRNIYYLVGFVNESKEFDAAVDNYTIYGKSKWSDYKGAFYAYLSVKNPGLSFDDFKSSIVNQ